MKICFPVDNNKGLASQVFNHVGSAPELLLVDVTTKEFQLISNCDQIHQHSTCDPVAVLGGHHVDAIIVGGIGGGALHKLNIDGIRVFKAHCGSVSENIDMLKLVTLQKYLSGHTCGGHGQKYGCSH